MQLKIRWSQPPPFRWDAEEDTVQVEETAEVEDLADLLEDVFQKKCAEFRAEEYLMQVEALYNASPPPNGQMLGCGAMPLDWAQQVSSCFSAGGNPPQNEVGCVCRYVPRVRQSKQAREDAKIPVVILTGFLGAGKTTVLNYILQEQRDKKIAVIENEFGEVAIDNDLLSSKFELAEQVILMDNGCMCCQVRGDLVEGLAQIQRKAAQGNPVDMVIIETSGMSDPGPIVKTFQENRFINEKMRYDGTLTVVDCKNCWRRLDAETETSAVNEAYQQIALADKILLNKLDLVEFSDVVAARERIQAINAFAQILPVKHGKVPMEEITDMKAHSLKSFTMDALDAAPVHQDLQHGHGGAAAGHGHGCDDDTCTEDHGGGHGHGHGQPANAGKGHAKGHKQDPPKQDSGHGHGKQDSGLGHGHGHKADSRHDSRVGSVGFTELGELTATSLGKLLDKVCQVPKDKGEVYRIKSILAVASVPQKVAFHAVMDSHTKDLIGPWAPGEPKLNKFVVIGKHLDRAYFEKAFRDSVVCKPRPQTQACAAA